MKVWWQCNVHWVFLIQGDTNEAGRLVVQLPNVNPSAFEMVLSYIYTDRIHPTKKGQTTL
jgi:hypothetical protein